MRNAEFQSVATEPHSVSRLCTCRRVSRGYVFLGNRPPRKSAPVGIQCRATDFVVKVLAVRFVEFLCVLATALRLTSIDINHQPNFGPLRDRVFRASLYF